MRYYRHGKLISQDTVTLTGTRTLGSGTDETIWNGTAAAPDAIAAPAQLTLVSTSTDDDGGGAVVPRIQSIALSAGGGHPQAGSAEVPATADEYTVALGGGAPSDGETFTVTVDGTPYVGTYLDAVADVVESTVVLGAAGDTYTLTVNAVPYAYMAADATAKDISTTILAGPYGGGAGGEPLIFTVTGSEGVWQYQCQPADDEAAITAGLAAAVNSGTTDYYGAIVGGTVGNGDAPQIAIAGDANSPYIYTATVPSDDAQAVAVGLAAEINDGVTGSTTYTAAAEDLGGGTWAVLLTAVASGAAAAHAITPTGSGGTTLTGMHIITGTDASGIWNAASGGLSSEIIVLTAVTPGVTAEDATAGDNASGGPNLYIGSKNVTAGTDPDDETAVAAAIVAMAVADASYTVANVAGVITSTAKTAGLAGVKVISSLTDGAGSFVSTNPTPGADATDPGVELLAALAVDPLYDVALVSDDFVLTKKITGATAIVVTASTTSLTATLAATHSHTGTDLVPAVAADVAEVTDGTLTASYTVQEGDDLAAVRAGLLAEIDGQSGYTASIDGTDILVSGAPTAWDFTDSSSGLTATVSTVQAGDDGNPGTGIRTVQVAYLDSTGLRCTETVALNGTTDVTTAATDVAEVVGLTALSVGSGGAAVGNVTAGDGASAVYAEIVPGRNEASSAVYTVPARFQLFVTSMSATATAAARVRLVAGSPALTQAEVLVSTPGARIDPACPIGPFPSGTVVKVLGTGNGTAVAVTVEGYLEPVVG